MTYSMTNTLDGIEEDCKIVMDDLVVGSGRCRLQIVHGDMDYRSSAGSDLPKRISGRAGALKLLDAHTEMPELHDTQVDLRLAQGAVLRHALLSRHNTYSNYFVILGGEYTE